jgi:uncharacterized membrane protein YoaK (UPF0700 family)
MTQRLPTLLSFNAGYVDTAGFLAMHGLFTAHVTGNFVTFGAALAEGTSGALVKLAALPVFCCVVILARCLGLCLVERGKGAFVIMLGLKCALLLGGAVLAVLWGPFPIGDSWELFVTGMLFVSAMAIQNGAHRVHLSSAPPTTLMTGTTTQIMLDIGQLLYGTSAESRPAVLARIAKFVPAVLAFGGGCLAAAGLFTLFGMWCFMLAPLVGLGAIWLQASSNGQSLSGP